MPHIIALVGPTAVGKTDISIELAKRLNAEIVGCDSMQVYRRMPILTQQPTPEQQAAVRHHLIDCIEPTEPFSVGQYRQQALAAIDGIQRRGKTALLVGGTGLYLKALTDGLCDAPPSDARIREALWEAIRQQGSLTLHDRLQQLDPTVATKIHPNDAVRLVRALEVYELTGKPLSSFWANATRQPLEIPLIGLTRERSELYDRINRRVERMIHDEGLLEEARQVLALPLSRTARQVHGLRYLAAYLNGEADLAQTIAQWQQQVRHYARRQLIWFRAEPRVHWITLTPDGRPGVIAERIASQLLTVSSIG